MTFVSLNDKPADDYWSAHLLKDLTKNLPDSDRKLIMMPTEYQDPEEVNSYLGQFEKVLFISFADEENKFNLDAINHDDIIIYSQFPNKFKNVDYYLPLGTTPHTQRINTKKTQAWFFAGQITHDSRVQLADRLEKTQSEGTLVRSTGFAKGLGQNEYMAELGRSKVVPCPRGAVSMDSFRLYEAIENGCIPVVEGEDYFKTLFGEFPFPTAPDWNGINAMIEHYKDRQDLANEISAWWSMQKLAIRQRIKKDLNLTEEITTIIPTSPIPSHPSIDLIAETIETARVHLNADIIVTVDGVRAEQEHRAKDYEEYVRRLLLYCHENNVAVKLNKEHLHQAEMLRQILPDVKSNNILYVEHDTPLTPDRDIEWPELVEALNSNKADMIRFHFEAMIHPEHEHLMIDLDRQDLCGAKAMRTIQWSQRPHLARTDWYRWVLDKNFTPDSRTMIEDKMHAVVQNAYGVRGLMGWGDYKIWIYTPDGNIKRSYHTDGRADEDKYEMKF